MWDIIHLKGGINYTNAVVVVFGVHPLVNQQRVIPNRNIN